MVLLTGLAGLLQTGNFPAISIALNTLADSLNGILLVRLGTRFRGRRMVGWSVAVLWDIAPMSVTFAIGGLETSVFILLLLATMTAYLWYRLNWTLPNGISLYWPLPGIFIYLFLYAV